MDRLNYIASLLLIAGGLNWGLQGVFDFNIVNKLFGCIPFAEQAIYGCVGLSALWKIFKWTQKGDDCGKGESCCSNDKCC